MAYLGFAQDFRRVGDIFLHDPVRYWPVVQLLETLLRKDSELSPAEREFIAAYVSKLSNCQFCAGMHRAVAEKLGAEISALDDLDMNAARARIDERLHPILNLAGKLTRSPHLIGQEDVDATISAGWSERMVEDVIGLVSLFAMVTRLSDGFGLRGEKSYFSEIAETLFEQGYDASLSAALLQKRIPT